MPGGRVQLRGQLTHARLRKLHALLLILKPYAGELVCICFTLVWHLRGRLALSCFKIQGTPVLLGQSVSPPPCVYMSPIYVFPPYVYLRLHVHMCPRPVGRRWGGVGALAFRDNPLSFHSLKTRRPTTPSRAADNMYCPGGMHCRVSKLIVSGCV